MSSPKSIELTAAKVATHLRVPDFADDKYRRGVTALVSGSSAYPGAGVLGVGAAWHAGAGMVRFLGSDRAQSLVLQAFPATVAVAGRFQAAVIGSGWDEELSSSAAEVLHLSRQLQVPVVVDAGAILRTDLWGTGRGEASTLRVITPHLGEASALWNQLIPGSKPLGPEDIAHQPAEVAIELAQKTDSVVVLKSANTVVADRGGNTYLFRGRTGWAGVAGSGDVLAGTIGALLSQRQADFENRQTSFNLTEVVASAVWMHGVGAAMAAGINYSEAQAQPNRIQPAKTEGTHPVLASQISPYLLTIWNQLS